jgi:hypothetical protein
MKTGSYFEGVPVLLAHTCLLTVLVDICWVRYWYGCICSVPVWKEVIVSCMVVAWRSLFRAYLERGHSFETVTRQRNLVIWKKMPKRGKKRRGECTYVGICFELLFHRRYVQGVF